MQILHGDCRRILSTLDVNSINTCVTSPPYFGLRDYGNSEQIGLEHSPQEYVDKLVQVFREVHRVLRDDGTVWLNLGDSYYNYRPGGHERKQTISNTNQDAPLAPFKRTQKYDGIKEKDLIGIPWRVAFALQADGWYLRQDIIWQKPNPMPESVTDRCTKSHEYIFLLSKSKHYYYDAKAIAEPAQYWGERDRTNGKYHNEGTGLSPHKGLNGIKKDTRAGQGRIAYGGKRNGGDGQGQESFVSINETRNKRSVWSVTTKPFAGAHFATYPPELIEPCILAGSPEGGVVLDPFNGSGTTGIVAIKNRRQYLGIELNEEYIALSHKRMSEIQVNLF